MNKQAPSIGRILAMVIFAMSCFGLMLFLWLAFGGPVPLKPEGYRVKVNFPEATTLAQEADVRMAGVNIGRVKTKELNEDDVKTTVELEIKNDFAPLPEDTKAILRQKTLLGFGCTSFKTIVARDPSGLAPLIIGTTLDGVQALGICTDTPDDG